MFHKLTEINIENKMATCSVCGPVKIGRTKRVKDKTYYSCSTKDKEFVQNWKNNNPESFNASVKKRNDKYRITKYKISVEDFNKMISEQNNNCKLCLNELKPGKGTAIDHCHATGNVRGILCLECNIGLGMFKDNIQTLRNAINYLK